MAVVWDPTTTANIPTAFTTPQAIPHVVGGLDDRRIIVSINTEDFSTGGGGQQPTSVTYNGNALTQDAFAVSESISTSMVYSGLDSDLGAAGSKDLVITFAGEVNRMIVAIRSASGMEQAVKEATGSLVQLASPGGGIGTSDITTISDGAIIIATFGESVGGDGTWSINVGTETFDLVNASMSAVGVQYEKTTAGAQAITATSTKNGGRLTGVSVAYAQASTTSPVITVPGAQQAVYGVQLPVSGILASDADTNIDEWVLSCTAGMIMTVTLSGAVTVDAGANGSADMTLGTGTQAELNTVMGTLRVDRVLPADLLAGDIQDTITLTVNDATGGFDTDTIVVNWTPDSGVGKSAVKLTGTAAQIIAMLEAGPGVTPAGGFAGALSLGMVSDAGNGLTDADLVVFTVAVPSNIPVVVNPGPQAGVVSVPLSIPIITSDVDGDIATVRFQSTLVNGTVDVSDLAGTIVAGGARGSNDLTLSGTHAQCVAAALNFESTGLLVGTDPAVTVTATDAGGLSDAAIFEVGSFVAPVVVNPGAQVAIVSVPRSIPIPIIDADSNVATVRFQSTLVNGTVDVSDLAGTSVAGGARGSNDLTLSGTHSQCVAAALNFESTGLIVGTDPAVTVTATDTGGLSDTASFEVESFPVPVILPTLTIYFPQDTVQRFPLAMPARQLGVGSGAWSLRRQWRRPRYEFALTSVPLSRIQKDTLESFLKYHQGDIPFWFDGADFGVIQSRQLFGVGGGVQRDFFLPNDHLIPASVAIFEDAVLQASVTITDSTGLVRFATPPVFGTMLEATYQCRYKIFVASDTVEVRRISVDIYQLAVTFKEFTNG